MGLRRCADLGKLIDDVGDDLRVILGEISVGKEVAEGVDDTARCCQDAGIRVCLGDGEIRIPDGPGIDGAGLERCGSIRRRKIQCLNVVDREPSFAQRLNRDVVGAGTALESDFLALEIGECLDR